MKTLHAILVISILLIGCNSKDIVFDDHARISSINGVEQLVETNYEEKLAIPQDVEQPLSIKPDKIIKTADIKIEVSDYHASKRRIDSIVIKWKGYISDENERTLNDQLVNNMTIRVSNVDFENLLNDIGEVSSNIDHKRITSIDVSEEYVDILARLKTKKEVQKRYYDLLKKATKIEDILDVEEVIRRMQEEIESKEGRLKYLDSRVSFSTINLEVYQLLEYEYKPKNKTNFFSRLLKALDSGWKGFLTFIIGILHIWPIMLLVAIGLIIYFRWKKG